MRYTKVLAALDFSSLTSAVFEQALDTAHNNQAQLLLGHCMGSDGLMSPPPLGGDLGLSPHLIDQTYRIKRTAMLAKAQYVEQWLETYSEHAIRSGVPTAFDYQVTEAATGICRLAIEWQADLIVMGRRGRKGLTEIFLGSTSNYVLHHAHCSVLVVQGESLNPPAPSHQHPNPIAARTR